MSKLFVTSFTEGSNLKWGLFYLDYKNEQQILKSEWKPVAFDTEEEAFSKLTAIEAEHHREENATAFNLVDAKKYAEAHKWKFASTYAKSAPHEYLVKKWLVEEDQLLYERFIATMKKNSVTESKRDWCIDHDRRAVLQTAESR